MNREYYESYAKENFKGKSQQLVLQQIKCFYDCFNHFKLGENKYKVGDNVFLKKGTYLHGTYRNMEGLKEVAKNGLIASQFTKERISKYPSCVSVWKLKQDYQLKDYINFYSGGTVRYFNQHD